MLAEPVRRARFRAPKHGMTGPRVVARFELAAALIEWTQAAALLTDDLDQDERLRPQLQPGGTLEHLARTREVYDALTFQLRNTLRGLGALASALAYGADDRDAAAAGAAYVRLYPRWIDVSDDDS